MSEIERLARAIHEGRSNVPWENSILKDGAYRDARSFITALSTPDEATIEAVARVTVAKNREYCIERGIRTPEWDDLPERDIPDILNLARAAIQALCSHIGGTND